MYPEEGRSAIAAAARAIADLRLGRVDEETTANVGIDRGRHAPEHRPRVVHVRRRGALARRAQARGARAGDGRRVLVRRRRSKTATSRRRCPRLQRLPLQGGRPGGAARASTRSSGAGTRPRTRLSGGAADANVFNERGLACLNLANGMADIHTPDEHITVDDLEGMVEVTLALVDAARDADA